MLGANYHTHTFRCRHADGTDEDYINAAIEAGMRVIGFSDHLPYAGDNPTYDHMDDRMKLCQIPEYLETMAALREKYRDRILVLAGFEGEYFPRNFAALWGVLKDYPIDYLILGQHYSRDWCEGVRVFYAQYEESDLAEYCQNLSDGIKTGKFSYIAHPDVFNWCGDDALFRKYMRPVCETAAQMGIPLEMNSPWDDVTRYYPSERMFSLAAECGNEVIIGIDAHCPEKLLDPVGVGRCMELVERYGLRRTEKIRLLSGEIVG